MKEIVSLAMLKMEKNFVAHNEKGYPRQPYQNYPIFDPIFEGPDIVGTKPLTLLGFIHREMKELDFAVEWAAFRCHPFTRENLMKAMKEVADVSNTLDYLFERLLEEYHTFGGRLI